MKIAVLGTGMVGRAFAARLVELGHNVVVGTRDPEATMSRTEPGNLGTVPYSQWAPEHPEICLLAFPDAGAHAELVVNATHGASSLDALAAVGTENLAGRILVDLALPLDMSEGMPPKLTIANDDSLAETIQRTYPDTQVVKTFNTLYYKLMLHPETLAGEQTVFIAGNDETAKTTVRETILSPFRWPEESIFDLGDITGARGSEMYARLFFTIASRRGNFDFNIHLTAK